MMAPTLQAALSNAGYQSESTSSGTRMMHFWHKFSQHDILLRREYMLRLLSSAALRKGRAYTFKQLRQMALPAEQIAEFQTHFMYLLEVGIFMRGYLLVCPHIDCEWTAWYPIDDVRGQMICEGCRRQFQMPLEVDFAYRLNPMAAEAFNNGALCVYLSAFLISKPVGVQSWQIGILIRSPKLSVEVDLTLYHDGELYFYECKDNWQDRSALIQQLERICVVAADAKAHVIFATLAETIPDEVTTFCAANAIRILTRADLVRG